MKPILIFLSMIMLMLAAFMFWACIPATLLIAGFTAFDMWQTGDIELGLLLWQAFKVWGSMLLAGITCLLSGALLQHTCDTVLA